MSWTVTHGGEGAAAAVQLEACRTAEFACVLPGQTCTAGCMKGLSHVDKFQMAHNKSGTACQVLPSPRMRAARRRPETDEV
jgi:hypothetical protein